MCRLGIIFLSAIFVLNFELCLGTCVRAEYEIDGECCPMCAPGNRVYRHCTEFTTTTCVPCVGATFVDVPNGLISCFSCAMCGSGQGLRVKTACTSSSDTVCEPLDRYYCTDQKRDSCLRAVRHSTCRPGQYIKQEGTALKDSECAECIDGTFSNGSLSFCQPHSKCEDKGLVEIKPGTQYFDVECGNKSSSVMIGVTVFAVLLAVVAAAAALFIFLKKKHKTGHNAEQSGDHTIPRQESNVLEPTKTSSVIPMLSCSVKNEMESKENSSVEDVQCKLISSIMNPIEETEPQLSLNLPDENNEQEVMQPSGGHQV